MKNGRQTKKDRAYWKKRHIHWMFMAEVFKLQGRLEEEKGAYLQMGRCQVMANRSKLCNEREI